MGDNWLPEDDPVVNSFLYLMERRGYEVSMDRVGAQFHVTVTRPDTQKTYRGTGPGLHKVLADVAERVGVDLMRE